MKTISFGFFIVRVDPMGFRRLMIGLAMLVAAGLAIAITPSKKIADQGSYVDLEQIIPKTMGNWQWDESIKQVVVNPQLQKVIQETYRQTLGRTYVDRHGNRIMLSIAYGGSYGEAMQTHKPEICYPAQGFVIEKEVPAVAINTTFGPLPTKRLVARMANRIEPITYWLVVGNERTDFGFQMKLAQIRYNITGLIPDGMLVRISSIDRNENRAFALQQQFIRDMLSALSEQDRARIIGKTEGL